jgi:hypothetical protein
MPISKIKGGAINDDAISTAKIVDDAVTSPKIVDSYTTALQTNPEFSGTEGARMPNGTTAQRANAATGDLRFNTTLSLMEYYDGSQWKSIDSPPVISSISPDNFDTAGDTITVTGSNFQSGATIKIIAADNQELTASSVTFTNSSTVTFDITAAMVADNGDPYDVVLTNPSGLAGTLADGLDFAPEPAWTKAAGSLGNVFDNARTSLTFTTGATSTESDATITYAVTTGSLPSGLSIASATGTITGSTSAVGSDTTTTFTITATATDGSSNTTTNTRQYSIVQKAPVITSYTSTGSGTFTVPTGLTTLDVLVVAGGGGAGNNNSGGGGAGGLIFRPAFPVTPGGSISYAVGAGGAGSPNGGPAAQTGQDSSFGTLLSKGGGRSGEWTPGAGYPGGSGGGAPGNPVGEPAPVAGQGIQGQQSGDSGTYGFGNPGGLGVHTQADGGGGGGGGAGAAGQGIAGHSYPLVSSAAGTPGGVGGIGKQYGISGSQVYYAGGGGGGGGGADNPLWSITGGQGGQGGGGFGGAAVRAPHAVTNAFNGHPGVANRGGGAGGGDNSDGGNGGSGIVIVKY